MLDKIVKKSDIDIIRGIINEIRTSYSLSTQSFNSLSKGVSPIIYNDIKEMRDSLDEIRDKINYYDSNPKTENWNNIKLGSIIMNSDFKQLINSTKNI